MLILVRKSVTHIISVLNVVTEMCAWSGKHREAEGSFWPQGR